MKITRLILIQALMLFLSCSSSEDNSICGNEVIKTNKYYEDLFKKAEGDKDHREDIASKLFFELKKIKCDSDNCDGEINRINTQYENFFIQAEGDKDHREDIILAMYKKLNSLNCY